MRTLAIGDIHGCYTSLTTLERYVSFSPDDLIISIGDYVDRGPESRSVIDWFISHRGRLTLVTLRGNHEVMMLAARTSERKFNDWVTCGGDSALRSYGSFADVPDSHWHFVQSCRPYYETQTHFFVHANAFPNLSLDEQPDLMLYWEQFNDPRPHQSGKVMICGHTPQRNGIPRSIGHAVCIDTWVYGDGWLTCLDVNTGQYWQANEWGETRESYVEIRA